MSFMRDLISTVGFHLRDRRSAIGTWFDGDPLDVSAHNRRISPVPIASDEPSDAMSPEI